MPIEVDVHNNTSQVRVKPTGDSVVDIKSGCDIDKKRIEALIQELQKTKQDLGFIALDEFVIDGSHGTLPNDLLNLLINYLINKVSYRDNIYYLILSDETTLVYYCPVDGISPNKVTVYKYSHQFILSNEILNIDHSALQNLDYLSSGHTGFAGIEFGTTEYWNSKSSYVPPQGMLVVYTDYATTSTGELISNFKIGDGNAHLVDKPFVGDDTRELLEEHVADMLVHVSEEDRRRWNNKLNLNAPSGDLLEFTRD